MADLTALIDRLTQGQALTHADSAVLASLRQVAGHEDNPGPGSVYTPAAVAQKLAAALGPLPTHGRLIDPACGAGALLVALVRTGATVRSRRQIAERLVGCDLNGGALDRARHAIALAVAEPTSDLALARDVSSSLDLRCADALLTDLPNAAAVVMNPPFEHASAMSKRDPAFRASIAARYSVCQGNWDLWCPFVQRALTLAQPLAPVGLILPDKVQQAPYATQVRRQLQHARASIVAIGRATPAAIDLVQLIARGGSPLAGGGQPWVAATGTTSTVLSDLADLVNAATVGEAYTIAEVLVDRPQPHLGDMRLITTGAIDPGVHRWGSKPQRYLKRTLLHPVLPNGALPQMAARIDRFRRPKIIIAGLTRRLEAVYDPTGILLPAKSTIVVLPHPGVDGQRLTDALNAQVTTTRWKERASGLALSGGYLRVTIGALSGVGIDWSVG